MSHQQMMQRILSIVKGAPDVAAGMSSLFAYGKALKPTFPRWKKLERIDYASDAQLMLLFLRDALSNSEITSEYTGFYFGLDGLNMPSGKGVEFGCSRHFKPQTTDEKWVYQCDLYPENIPSESLSAAYRTGIELGELPDYIVCFGFLGLALRQAFDSIPAIESLNGAPYRAIMWGYHDGDLQLLGVVHPQGLQLAK
jgi:hypothetical protein